MVSKFVLLCCVLSVFSSILVIYSKNALHSILFLVSTFFFSSVTIFSQESEFLALFFLIIYLGAIVILFLFVLMMLDLKQNLLKINKLHFPTGLFIGFISFFFIKNAIDSASFSPTIGLTQDLVTKNNYFCWENVLVQTTNVKAFADAFYNHYVAQILIAGILLYVSVVGVVFLTSTKYKKFSSSNIQSLTKQLSRRNIL